jgi:hypothetical protein
LVWQARTVEEWAVSLRNSPSAAWLGKGKRLEVA